MSPAQDNQLGFWESRLVMALNDDALRQAEQNWWTIKPLCFQLLQDSQYKRHRTLAGRVLDADFQEGLNIVVKEPRLCRLVPLWHPVLIERCARLSYAMIIRDPREVSESLRRRNGLDPKYSLLLWARYVLDAERHTRGHQRAYVSYAALLQDWRSTIRCLEDVSGLRLQAHANSWQIEAFLCADLRNHCVQKRNLSEQIPLVGRVHAVLDKWAGGSAETHEDYSVLDLAALQLNELSCFVPAHSPQR